MLRRITKKYLIPHKENNFRPYLLRGMGVFLTLVFVLGAFFASNVYRIILTTNDFLAAILPAVLVDLANANRSSYDLPSLTINPLLEQAARLKAEDMAAKSYFAHYSPEGVSPWHWFGEAGYTFVYAGENLAIHFDDSTAVNEAWMNSPGHRANILNSHFTEIGIATARGMYEGQETTFVVQEFGSLAREPLVTKSPVLQVSDTETPVRKTVAVVEPNVVPIASSTILGTVGKETFVAVKNVDVVAVTSTSGLAASVISPGNYASFFERFITSPAKILALVYAFISAVLLLTLIFVLFVRHERRGWHLLYILVLLLVMVSVYYVYKFSAFSAVTVLSGV